MKIGLPLYVVGTSTYGVVGGLILPGFVMGILQFGWIGVNAYGVATLLCKCFGIPGGGRGRVFPIIDPVHAAMVVVFACAVAFMGLKGIQYVARVATFFPPHPDRGSADPDGHHHRRRGELLERTGRGCGRARFQRSLPGAHGHPGLFRHGDRGLLCHGRRCWNRYRHVEPHTRKTCRWAVWPASPWPLSCRAV